MKSKKKIWIRFGISAAFAVIFLLFALFAGKFAPYDPLETHYTDLLKAPCKQYLLGTRWEEIFFLESSMEEKLLF